ncbi:MAG: hypothetical protein KDD41_07815 [Flavobacteriales bacterium]|nr:hypothetical protein [Flavobacteriales bacterium]
MKTKLSLLTLVVSVFFSCEFNKSVKLDLLTGLSTQGDGLSAGDVYLTINEDERIKRNTFVYGEIFYLNFNDVKGFVKEGENVFPGMELTIVGEKGDTAMHYDDMYANETAGVNITPLLLYTNVTVAKPMTSNQKYTLHVHIWDKKGTGTYRATFNFDVVPNDQIAITKDAAITYNNIYLFSKEDGTITDNKIKPNQTYFMLFEGLTGFKEEEGRVSVGLSVLAKSNSGEILLDEKDLLGDGEWEPGTVYEQVSSDIIFRDPSIQTPISCEFVIYDKKSEASISASVSLEFEK